MTTSARTSLRRDERGTSLILALVFVFAIGMVLIAIGGLAANALLTTSNARSQRTTAADAETAVTIAMQYIRYTPTPESPPSCLPPSPTVPSSDPRLSQTNPVQVDCTISVAPTDARTRVVEFYACAWGTVSLQSCETSDLLLHAEIVYNDLNEQGVDDCFTVPVVTTTSCGMDMSVDLWDVIGADT